MAQYFFDTFDGGAIIDDMGTEYPNVEAAHEAAVRTLPDIARDEIAAGRSREVSVLVRNDAGRALFVATLTLSTRSLIEKP